MAFGPDARRIRRCDDAEQTVKIAGRWVFEIDIRKFLDLLHTAPR